MCAEEAAPQNEVRIASSGSTLTCSYRWLSPSEDHEAVAASGCTTLGETKRSGSPESGVTDTRITGRAVLGRHAVVKLKYLRSPAVAISKRRGRPDSSGTVVDGDEKTIE